MRDKLTIAGLAVILVATAFFYYGWYRWENRPPQTVQYIQQSSGNNSTFGMNTEKPKDRRFLTGIYGNQKEVGAVVGWLW